MLTFNGLPIHVSEHCTQPKLRVGQRFRELCPELAAETDAWLLEFFGAEEHAYKLTVDGREVLLVSPRAYRQLVAESSLKEFMSLERALLNY